LYGTDAGTPLSPDEGRCTHRPASRDGVGPSCVVVSPGPWPTLLDFLTQRFASVARQTWLQRLAHGDVLDATTGHAISVASASQPPCPVHARLYYFREVAQEAVIPFEHTVLYQDEHLLVADKPHFLPVVPSGGYLNETLLVRLKRQFGLDDLAPIHRLDRDTAGLVMFAKTQASRAAFGALFRQRKVQKTYHAIARWQADLVLPQTRHSRIRPAGHFMLQHEVPGQPNASTHIELLDRQGDLARYRLTPLSGQRHQLRVHMLALGVPILHDGLYPVLSPAGTPDHSRPLQLLARTLDFTDPMNGQARQFVSQRRLMY